MIGDIFGLITPFVIPILIIWLIWKAFQKKNGKKDLDVIAFFTKNSTLQEIFFALAFGFSEIATLAINRDLGSPIQMQYIPLAFGSLLTAFGYKLKLQLTTFVGIITLTSWTLYKVEDYSSKIAGSSSAILLTLVIGCFGIIYYLGGRLIRSGNLFRVMGTIFTLAGALLTTGYLFVLSTESGLSSLAYDTKDLIFNYWQLSLIFAVFILMALVMIIYATVTKVITKFETFSSIMIIGLLLVLSIFINHDLLIEVTRFSQELSGTGLFLAVITNAVCYMYILFHLFSGYVRKEATSINVSIFFLVIFLFVKYFDWFYDFLDKSLFFIGAGIFLFVIGFGMERGRRSILDNMRREV